MAVALALVGMTACTSNKIQAPTLTGPSAFGVGSTVAFTPAFTASPTSPAAYQAVVFDATTTKNPNGETLTYAWTFGDGQTATGRTVSHTYSLAGTYAVTLTVTNASSQSAFVTQSLTVGASTSLPTALFAFSPSTPAAGQSVYFNASASTAGPGHTLQTFNWDFGDGVTASGVTANHAYSVQGTYSVTLSVADEVGQRSTVTNTVAVASVKPVASFTFSPSTATAPATIYFSSTSTASPGHTIASYSWDFGDGGTQTGTATPSHSFAAAGTYTVTLTVTDDAGNSASTTQQVTLK